MARGKSRTVLGVAVALFLAMGLASTPTLAGGNPDPGGVPAISPPEGPPFAPGELLVKVEPRASVLDIASAAGARVDRTIAHGSIHVLALKNRGASVPATAAALNGMRGVMFAEPNWLRQFHDAPNDGDYDLKWDLHNDGSLCDGTDCAATDADLDWQEAYTSLGSTFNGSAVVTVLDTGIDAGHPDLNGKIVTGYDYLDGDVDPKDTYGHGTHVAGIALAETNNGQGTAGIGYSPNIQVMPLRVGDEYGVPTSAAVDAIYHAADNGAHVINMSFGGKFGSLSEEQAINYAWGKGLVVVASSGNDGSGRVSYPAAYGNCIAVGATNWHDQLAPYSNKGSDLDVVAPGGDMDRYDDPGGIYSTMPTYDVYLTTSYSYDKYYDQLQGTSMASPQVAGLAGLLFAVGVTDTNGDGKSNDEIRDIIESSADDLGKPGWDREYGWGRINVHSAVQKATGDGDGPPSVTITNPQDGETVSGTVTVTADASDDSGVTQVEFFVDHGSIGTDTNGSDGWSATWDTTTVADGTHEVAAEVTDTADQIAADTIAVTVSNDAGAGTMHISNIEMWYIKHGPNYFVYTSVTVVDESSQAVSDASVGVTTTLPNTSLVSGSGVTDSEGTAVFRVKSQMGGTYESEVTDVSHNSLTYDSSANVETSDTLTVA